MKRLEKIHPCWLFWWRSGQYIGRFDSASGRYGVILIYKNAENKNVLPTGRSNGAMGVALTVIAELDEGAGAVRRSLLLPVGIGRRTRISESPGIAHCPLRVMAGADPPPMTCSTAHIKVVDGVARAHHDGVGSLCANWSGNSCVSPDFRSGRRGAAPVSCA
jgi:hypothetical protein